MTKWIANHWDHSLFYLFVLVISISAQGCSGCARFTIQPHSLSLAGSWPSETLGRVHVEATVERRKQLLEPEVADAILKDAVERVFNKAGYLVVRSAAEADFTARAVADNVKFSRGLSGAWSNAKLEVITVDRGGREIVKRAFNSKQRGRNSEVAFTGAVSKCLQAFYSDLTSPSWREALRAAVGSPADSVSTPVPAAPTQAPAAAPPPAASPVAPTGDPGPTPASDTATGSE